MIKFWDKNGQYADFSNFAEYFMHVDGRLWRTVEHFFQAMKSPIWVEQEKIRQAASPKEAKKMGKEVQLRDDWESIKYEIMKQGVMAKFSQNEDVRQLLFNTFYQDIAEDSPYDYIWGLGKNGTGQNLLGKVLMEVREELREICHQETN